MQVLLRNEHRLNIEWNTSDSLHPTQLLIHLGINTIDRYNGQWWSIFRIHTLHLLQWWARAGFMQSHFLAVYKSTTLTHNNCKSIPLNSICELLLIHFYEWMAIGKKTLRSTTSPGSVNDAFTPHHTTITIKKIIININVKPFGENLYSEYITQ